MAHKYVDFSSDDDFGSSAKKKAYKRRSLGGPIYNREYFMNEILGYTDEELFQHLKRYNFDCGPVSGSTRKVYQKKLADKMVEGPPPPPPKMQRRSMGPTFRSLPTKLPDPNPEDDFISGSSGSDIEGEYREVEPDMPQGKTAHANLVQEKYRPSDANHKGSGNYAKKANPSDSMLPTIQLRRLEREDRSTPPPLPPPPPPEDEAPKHPPKIQPMHREKVKPKPRPNASKESSSQEEVSIWVQVVILVICLFVTALFLKYIESTETLPFAPDLTVDPPVTPNIHGQFQHETTHNQTDTPPEAPTPVSEEVPPISSEESENKFIPADPKPDNPLPADPKPDNPLPDDPKPDNPPPDDPKPDNPPPADPKPDNPPPTDPKPDNPLPADQKPVESPVKDKPTNAKASIKGKEKSKKEKSKAIPSSESKRAET